MLNAMRSGAKSWVVKVFLGLLVLSFALWGVGDIFLGSGAGADVAEVGNKVVTSRELDQAFSERVQQFGQMGAGLTREQAVSFGFMGQALNDLLQQKRLELHAEELGLSVADSEVAAAVRGNPIFSGMGGFDPQRFALYLRSIGASEEAYLAAVRGELMRGRLLQAFAGQLVAPTSAVETVNQYRGETRSGKLLIIDPENTTVEPASEEDLQTYLSENEAQFTAPEYREVEIVILDVEELSQGIEPAESEIEAYYQQQIAFYTTPATRTVTQLLAADKAVLENAITQLGDAGELDAVVEAMAGDGLSAEELGPFTRGELPEPLDGAVWAADDAGFSEPVESAFGWHSFRVVSATDETVAPLEDMRDELVRAVALNEANVMLPDLARALDDEIGAGETLGSAADRLQLSYFDIAAIDRGGLDSSGAVLSDPRLSPDMLDSIFTSQVDQISLLEIGEDERQYVFNIKSVTEPRPRTLDEVRSDVEAGLLVERQIEEATSVAEQLLTEAADAGGFDGMDEPEGVSLSEFGPVMRGDVGQGAGFDAAGLEVVFDTAEGAIASQVVQLSAGPAIVMIEAAEPASDDQNEALGGELVQAIQGDLLRRYLVELEKRYPHDVNEAALAYLMDPPEHQHNMPGHGY